MAFRARKPNQKTILNSEHLFSANSNQRRWRMAFTAISFTRLLVSLSKKTLDEQTKLLRSLPYVAIQVNEDTPRVEHVAFISIDHKALSQMVKEKTYDSLNQLGGIMQVAALLQCDVKEGINGSEADLARRKEAFGANRYNKPPAKSFLSFVLEALKDTTIIILLVCAILSLSFGMKQHGPKDGWYDGGSIIVAIFLVVVVSAVSNFKQARQFVKLSDETCNIKVQVVRDGRHQNISIFDVVVGDVVSLKIGDQIPADGLFLDGYSLKIDESSMTGESDHVEVNDSRNPFLLCGTKVTDGFGSMLVTSVGMNTAWGEMMSSISQNLDEETPLQARLNKLTSYIGKAGLAVALLVLAVMTIRYFTGNTTDEYGHREYNGSKTKVNNVLNSVVEIIAAAVTIVVVAIPEGLPLAVTLTLAYSMKRMMNDNALVRQLSEISGSPTEKAILSWAALDLGMNINETKRKCEIINVETFNSERKRSGVMMRKNNEKAIHTHWKGAAEMIVAMCSTYYVRSGELVDMNEEERKQFKDIIHSMGAKSLRCIAFAHRKVAEQNGQVSRMLDETECTLLGLVGLKDPCRPGVRAAVESCKKAEVNVKMITGDNPDTARAIAIECGILNPAEDVDYKAVVEGVEFRNYSSEERMARIDDIRVMARSSPFDKLLMVQCLCGDSFEVGKVCLQQHSEVHSVSAYSQYCCPCHQLCCSYFLW